MASHYGNATGLGCSLWYYLDCCTCTDTDMHQGSIAPDSSDEGEEFLFDDDICELDEDELRRLEQCAGAYTGQSVDGSQSLLIKYGLLGELYIQQKMDHVAFEAAVKRGDGPKPSKPRLPYRSVGDEGAIITTDTPSSHLSGGSTGSKKKRGRQTTIAFGSPKRAKGGSKGGGRGRGSPNGSRGRGKSPASALTSGKSTQSVALSDTKRQLIKELSKQ